MTKKSDTYLDIGCVIDLVFTRVDMNLDLLDRISISDLEFKRDKDAFKQVKKSFDNSLQKLHDLGTRLNKLRIDNF